MTERGFWLLVFLLFYTYAGYPLLIHGLSKVSRRKERRLEIQPRITVVVVARNEERNIRRKIENLLEQDYPRERVRILVASDASTDGTDTIVGEYRDRGVRLLRVPERAGKASLINRAMEEVEDEIIVMSDARQTWSGDAIQNLVARFGDPKVGAVSGELVLQGGNGNAFSEGVGLYWEYEKFIRKREALVDSTCGLTGCIYAMRKSLFRKIPADTLLDDFVIPMNIVRQGRRVVFEESALAFDEPSREPTTEMNRKIRTLVGNYQAFFRMPWLFNPFRNRLFVQVLSHKFLRLTVPFLLIGIVAGNIALASMPFYRVLLGLQAIFYLLAVLSISAETRFLRALKTFIILNAAAFQAFFVFMAGRQKVTWK